MDGPQQGQSGVRDQLQPSFLPPHPAAPTGTDRRRPQERRGRRHAVAPGGDVLNGLSERKTAIPAHWTWKKIKYLASLRSGDTITSDSISDSGDYPVYGGNGIRGFTSSATHRGDYVLIGRQGALCGNINYASGEFWASEHAVVVDTRGRFNVRWLGEVLRSMNLNQYSQSAAQPGLS